jgi:hypothetical protein
MCSWLGTAGIRHPSARRSQLFHCVLASRFLCACLDLPSILGLEWIGASPVASFKGLRPRPKSVAVGISHHVCAPGFGSIHSVDAAVPVEQAPVRHLYQPCAQTAVATPLNINRHGGQGQGPRSTGLSTECHGLVGPRLHERSLFGGERDMGLRPANMAPYSTSRQRCMDIHQLSCDINSLKKGSSRAHW